MSRLFVRANEFLVLQSVASTVQAIRSVVLVREESGQLNPYHMSQTTTANRVYTATTGTAQKPVSRKGEIVGAVVGMVSELGSGIKRGQLYSRIDIVDVSGLSRQAIVGGYLYETHTLTLGDFQETTDGRGYLNWVQEANDAAGNVVTTVSFATTNARRIVRGVIIKYHQTGGSAATITATLRDMATAAGPTNWSIDSDTWVSPDLVLGADQEGLMHIGEHGFLSTNDAGVLAYADNTTAPNPFPFEVNDTDTVDLLVAASGGASGDDYDVWVQYEEWIEV